MIWFLLLLSLLFAGVDFLFYRVRMRRHSERLRRAFVWFAVFSDALPIVVVLLLKAVPDNTTGWMRGSPMVYLRLPVADRLSLRLLFRFVVRSASGFSRVGALFAVGCAVWLVWGAAWGRQAPAGEQVEIRTTALPAAFDGFRIVQFSDLHIGTLVRPEREMNRLVDTINALRPDLVVFSGDLVNVRSTELTSDVLAILGRLRAPYGVISTLGNHDVGLYIKDTVALPRAENNRQVIDRQRKIGWRMLLDSTLYLRRGSDSISVTGISFRSRCKNSDIRSIFPKYPRNRLRRHAGGYVQPDGFASAATVAQYHRPRSRKPHAGRARAQYADQGTSLRTGVLSGTTDVRPLGGRYDDAAGNTLYINDGIGYVGFPDAARRRS